MRPRYCRSPNGLLEESGCQAEPKSTKRISNREPLFDDLAVLHIFRIQSGAFSFQRRGNDERIIDFVAIFFRDR
jgi:hypothetical protein